MTDPHIARQVEALAAYGVAEPDIARILKVRKQELRDNYTDELETGAARANSRVAENLYRRATGEGREAVTAAIFWLKTRAGWKETSTHEITGRNGGPVELPVIEPRRAAMAIFEMLRRAGYTSLPAFLNREPGDEAGPT